MRWPCARPSLLLGIVLTAAAAVVVGVVNGNVFPSGVNANNSDIPHFDHEPAALVEFSNTIGAQIPCHVSGFPQPQTTWQLADGSPLTGGAGLRDVHPDGTLVFRPFKAEDFRQDVHVVWYRCAASNALGTVISRDVRVKAVIKQRYEIYVYDTYAIRGNAAVIKCHVPNFLKDYVTVIAWLRDNRYVINNTDFGSDQPYVVLPDGQLYIRETEESDHGSSYKCKILHRLTNETKLSSTEGKLFVSEPQTKLPPRFIATPVDDITAVKGTTVVLPCVSQGNPVPTIRWYRKSSSGRLEQLKASHPSGALLLRSVTLKDDGIYVCTANNEIFQEKVEIILRISEPLRVSMNPKKMLSEVGSPAKFSCDIVGVPLGSISWLKDGKTLHNDDSVVTSQTTLSINSVEAKHKGVYQCIGKNEFMTSHSEGILNLGETPPEFKSAFKELELNPGSEFSLHCAVSGSPLPELTWLLDSVPVSRKDSVQHVDGIVKSWLNASNIRSEDGGVYTCVAKNDAGISMHSARISVYGRLTARRSTKISVISGKSVTLICPVYGHPIETVLWKKGGIILPENHRQIEWSNGTLSIYNVHKSYDNGLYECQASNSEGENALGLVELSIMVPPKIVPFSFQEDLLREGTRARLQCVVSEGDSPLSIHWNKDGHSLPANLGIIVREIDEFSSILAISSVSSRHNGEYACIASNNAAIAIHSAILSVNVVPKIIPFSFQDDQFFNGMRAHIICAVSQGDFPLQFLWLKDGQPIPASLGILIRNIDGHANSLSIDRVSSGHTGNYTCVVRNRAAEVTHTAQLLVYVAPKISPFAFQEASIVEGSFARVTCLIYQGDLPIDLRWLKDGKPLIPTNGVSIKVIDEYSTMLTLENVRHIQAGNYTCVASNSAASAQHTAQLHVRVPPKIVPFAFQDDNLLEGMLVRVSCVVSRGDLPLTITWLKEDLPLPTSLPVIVREFDEYSSVLSIDPVTVQHNGNYTCLVRNHAGTTHHTSQLLVNVPPRWIVMPQNVTAVRNKPLTADCQADGFPKPNIVWKKVLGLRRSDQQQLMATNSNITIHLNGSMQFREVKLEDEGFYFCYASNGVGLELSKAIFIRVQAPVYFKITESTQKVKLGTDTKLECEAFGDLPISFRWSHNTHDISTIGIKRFQSNTFNATAKEAVVAALLIQEVHQSDGGKYYCHATNKYGNTSAAITLVVQEPPMYPEIFSVKTLGNRSVEIMWNQPSDGNAPILNYTLQFKRKQDSWISRSSVLTYKANTLKAIIGELQPATIYEFRLAAQNEVGLGQYSSAITVIMGEEAPTGSPQQVEVEAVDPQTLRISWKPPKKSLWNGVIRGYYVGYKEHGSSLAYSFTTLEVPEDYTEDLIYQLTNLNMYTQYSIVVQAYNKGGRGPSSEEVLIMTSEDIPSEPPRSIRCSSLSSRSVYVIWDPPPTNAIHGILRGYKVVYRPLEQWHDGSSKTNSTAVSRITLSGLQVDTNYSIQVLAFTKLGDGVKSDPVFCKTYEDVPGSPEAIKALPVSSDTVLVSWKPPARPNGAITKYNIYYTPLGQGEEHKDFANTEGLEGVGVQTMESDLQYYELKGLEHNTKYAFWVTAISSIGEGPISAVITQEPANKDVPAMTASFDEVIKTHWKRDLVMPCRGVGIPPPSRRWFQSNRLVKENERVVIRFDGTLVIKKPNSEDSGNYTCRITNKLGTDEVHYSVNVVVPPGSPTLDILSKSLTSVRLRWRPGPDGGDEVQGYFLHFKRDGGQWDKKELAGDITTYTLEKLSCGATYQLYVEAFNNVGTGPTSEILTVTTHGESFQLPQKESLIQEGATFVTIHLDSWPSTGCPVQFMRVEYKQLSASEWVTVSNNIKPSQKKLVIPKLSTATWYVLRVTAFTNEDDFNIGEYIFSTQTAAGGVASPDINQMEEKVIMFHLDPWIFIPVVGLIIVCIITSVVIFVYYKRRPRRKQPDDWTQYAGTLARAHELGVSVESFVRLPKSGDNTATLARNGTIWRRGNEPNPYATIRLPQYCSEMTLMRERRGSRPSRMVQQVPVINTDAGWVAVGSATGGITNPFENPQLWPEAYGVIQAGNDVYGNPAQYQPRNKSSNIPSQQDETRFAAAESDLKQNVTESVVAAEMHTVMDTTEDEDKANMSVERKDAEVGEDAWLIDKGEISK